MRESALLQAVTEYRHGLALHDLVHEDADHVAVAVADVLPLAIHVVRAEDHVLQPEHPMRGLQVQLHGVL